MDRMDISAFEAEFEREIAHDDDSEARQILASGKPIYVSRDDTPDGYVVQVFPDGREELLKTDWEALGALLGR